MAKPPKAVPLGSSSRFIRMGVVGGHGFGKTVFAASAPNALFLMSDPEGAESATSLGIGKGNDEWPIPDWDEMDEVYKYMLDEGCDEYDWLVHDNASTLNKLAMKKAMEQGLARPGSKLNKYVPDKPQYQFSQNAFLDLVMTFNDLPINQIWLVRPRMMTIEDPEEGEIDVMTADVQNDSIAESFLGAMKIVGMGAAYKDEDDENKVRRRLYFSHQNPYRGKDRTHSLVPYKDNLTVPKMMELIEAKRAGRPAKRVAKKTAATRRRRTA